MSLSFAAESLPTSKWEDFQTKWEIEVFIYRCYKESFQTAYQSITKLALDQDYTNYHL